MKIEVIECDLFEFEGKRDLVHCISADFALGAGIAKNFKERGIRDQLRSKWGYPDYLQQYDGKGHALKTGHVWNLVTKAVCRDKPTYKSMVEALVELRAGLATEKIDKIAMPKIGCGLDRLSWEIVFKLINKVFEKTNVDIIVCVKNTLAKSR
jgi:hypothetical protein